MDKITIAVISVSGLLIAVAIIISLTAGGTAAQQQQQQQSFAQVQELTESSVSDFFNNHGYIVRLYEFRQDNGDLIIYAERTNRSVTPIPPSPAEID
jgi:type II secretory pathway pseudopilin PulG